MSTSIFPSLRCSVKSAEAIYAARSMLRAFATQVGFEREVIEELVIVVSELATNILKYGERGTIEFSVIERDTGLRGISIIAEDMTPPFDLIGSLRDGYDARGKLDAATFLNRGGIGAGLGAISRLSDGIELVPQEKGKRLVVHRFLGRPRRGSCPGF